jgi:NAD(P)-dependent dehydrogenase (short-subunit alcohol dehydrogenase family)
MKIVITGCSTGIGRAAAIELTRRGHHVIATARDPKTLDDLDVAERHQLDITDNNSVATLAAAVPAVDVIVNNAGSVAHGAIEDTDIDDLKTQFDTNVLGALRLIKTYLPAMRAQHHGVIVNVTSLNGRFATPLSGPYTTTKFALEGLSESLALDTRPFGIRVAIVEPGLTRTNAVTNAAVHTTSDPYVGLAEQWEQRRLARLADASEPSVIAAVIANAVEDTGNQLRYPAGPDAEFAMPLWKEMGDVEFYDVLRATLELNW